MIIFSKVLKDIRKKEDLTQKELAITLSVSRSAVAQIENSNNNPSRDLMLKLLNLFDLNDDDRKQIEVIANGIEPISILDKVPVGLLKEKENTSYGNIHVWDTYSKILKNKQNILCLCILLKENKYEFSVEERVKLLEIEKAVFYLQQVVFGIVRFREHVFNNFLPALSTSNELIEDFTNALLPYYSKSHRDFRDLFYPREYKDDNTDQPFSVK